MQVTVGGARPQQRDGGRAIRLEGGPVTTGVGGEADGRLVILEVELVQLVHVDLEGLFDFC